MLTIKRNHGSFRSAVFPSPEIFQDWVGGVFAGGSVAAAAEYGVDSLLIGADPNERAVFLPSVWDRNPDCFAFPLNMTCIIASGGNGVLVSADTIACANHSPASGTLTFVTMDGQTVTRTTGATALVVDDVLLVKLSSALPGTITPAKVLPSNWLTYLPAPANSTEDNAHPWRVPMVSVDNDNNASVHDFHVHSRVFSSIVTRQPAKAPRLALYDEAGNNDSGCPCGFVIGSQFVPTHTWSQPKNGSLICNNAAFQSALSTLGGAAVTEVNLSGFNAY